MATDTAGPTYSIDLAAAINRTCRYKTNPPPWDVAVAAMFTGGAHVDPDTGAWTYDGPALPTDAALVNAARTSGQPTHTSRGIAGLLVRAGHAPSGALSTVYLHPLIDRVGRDTYRVLGA